MDTKRISNQIHCYEFPQGASWKMSFASIAHNIGQVAQAGNEIARAINRLAAFCERHESGHD